MFKDIIDDALATLQDDGTLFSRGELLSWARDGLRIVTAQTAVARTFKTYALPPRHSFAITYEWERRYVERGTYRKFTFAHETARLHSTSVFEIGIAGGVIPFPGLMSVTQLWELARAGEQVEAHYRLYFPRSQSSLRGLWWDHKRLRPVGLSELDDLQDAWWKVQGDPFLFNQSLGHNQTADIYEIVTTYHQPYKLIDHERGMPTDFSGDRTYTVDSLVREWDYAYTATFEAGLIGGLGLRLTRPVQASGLAGTYNWEDGIINGTPPEGAGRDVSSYPAEIEVSLGLGAWRGARSVQRQYVPEQQWVTDGICRSLGSSEDNILCLYAASSEPEDQDERDALHIIPIQMGKYLRYYVLFQAFNRQGEGYDPSLASVYQQRFSRALQFLRRIANVAHRDAGYSRTPKTVAGQRIAQPSLPSQYARAPWL